MSLVVEMTGVVKLEDNNIAEQVRHLYLADEERRRNLQITEIGYF